MYETLDEITIGKFIDVYLGNYGVLVKSGFHNNEELQKKAAALIYEYSGIVKGKRQLVELYRKDEILCLQAKIVLLETCLKIIAIAGGKTEAIDSLRMLGYIVNEQNVESKLKQVIGKFQFQLEMASLAESEEIDDKGVQVNRSHFTKEMAMVMKYNKFTFSLQGVSAAMYAHWLRDMVDYFNFRENAK